MSLQTVGRYQITGELGKGAMGVVYTALDPMIGRAVALKTMRLDVHGIEQQEVLQRFRNEARAGGVLNHPNIVTIYDAGEQDGMFYIAMEVIEGTTLHQMMAQHRTLPAERVIEMGRQICAGLDYAHAHGVIHRDVKPANIMITPAGMVKIMDFGIAKSMGGGMTTDGQVLGTPNYMSPEQVKGKPLDGRSDLFSLGVVLYEMLTGEKPFSGQNVTTIIYKIVNEDPVPPAQLDPKIHPGLSTVITRCLAKSPEERYQTGAALVRELENHESIRPPLDSTSVIASDVAPKASELTGSRSSLPKTSAKIPAAATGSLSPSRSVPASMPAAAAAAAAPSPHATSLAESKKAPVQPLAVKPISPQRRHLFPLLLIIVGFIFAAGGFALWRYNRQLTEERERATAEQAKPAQATPPETSAPPADTPAQATVAEPQPSAGLPVAPVKANPAVTRPATKAPTSQAGSSKPGAVAAANVGELSISSTPAGASVTVDGWSDPRWVTPFVVSNLAPGEHQLVISKTGFVAHSRRVNVEAGKRASVSAALTSSAAALNLASQPPGAEILLDGKPTGKVTPARITTEQGEHRVVLRLKGYKEAAVTARIAEGQTFNYAPNLSPEKTDGGGFSLSRIFGGGSIPKGQGMVDVRTSPKKADIFVDGRKAPKLSPYKFPLPPGPHLIVIQLEGYRTVEKKITVEEGKVMSVNEQLQKN